MSVIDLSHGKRCKHRFPYTVSNSVGNSVFFPLKWHCHEIFGNFLFYESNLSGPLINRLKWLCLDICFRGDIQNLSLKNLTPRSVSQREVRLHAVLVTFGFLQISFF